MSGSERLVCWRCGEPVSESLLPLARRAECPACGADLHVCRLCRYFDPAVSGACREPIADWVQDKDRANFCGYFQPAPVRYAAAANREARAAANALFGSSPPGPREDEAAEVTAAEQAKAEWDRLFGIQRPNGGGD